MMTKFACFAALAVVIAPIGAAPAIAKQEPAEVAAPERLICKRWAEVGSLVRKRKQCHTKAEWERLAEMERTGTQKTMDGLTERSSCAPPSPC